MKRRRLDDMRTMKALFATAERAAMADGEPIPGAEHLVLAALELPESSARRAFERVGVDPSRFRSGIAGQHADALHAIGIAPADAVLDGRIPAPAAPRGLMRTSGSAQELFQAVVKMVRKEKSQLYGAYFVLGAAQTEHGTVARALRYLDIDPRALAQAARAELDDLKA